MSVTSLDEGDMIQIDVTVDEPATDDTLALLITWEPGVFESFDLDMQGATTASFSFFHTYRDDNPTGTSQDDHLLQLHLTDDDTGFFNEVIDVTVFNVMPELFVTPLTPLALNEGETFRMEIEVRDPGIEDTFELSIDWDGIGGEGPELLTFMVEPDETITFEVEHLFEDDDPSGTPSDDIQIQLSLQDDDFGAQPAIEEVVDLTINNVVPTVTISPLSSTTINEGESVDLEITVTDPGIRDSFEVEIEWEPGVVETLSVPAEDTDTHVVTVSHAYDDDNPTGTSSDLYNVKVRVEDDDTGVKEETVSVTVNNLDPVVDPLGPFSVVVGTPFSAVGSFSDDGSLDTHSHRWTFRHLPSGFTFAQTGQAISAVFNALGTWSAEYEVTDDDTGSDMLPFNIEVIGTLNFSLTPLFGPALAEGDTVDIDVSVSPTLASDSFRVEIDWGDGVVNTYNRTGQNVSGTYSHTLVDDLPTGTPLDLGRVVEAKVYQYGQLRGSSTEAYDVRNIEPTVNAINLSGSVAGAVSQLTVDFDDPGSADTHTFTWDFGDGSPITVTNTPTVSHVFNAGSYNVQLTVEDDDTGTDTFTQSGVTISPLMVQAGAAEKEGPGEYSLQLDQAKTLLPAAIDWWRQAGAPVDDLDLDRLEIDIQELAETDPRKIAWFSDGVIVVDDDAAGYGWFVDASPQENSEFDLPFAGQLLRSRYESPAYGRLDLLTVLAHEIGHALDRNDLPSSHGIWSVMADTLSTGERRIPVRRDWDPGFTGESLPIGPLNGDFGEADPNHDSYGWISSGDAQVEDGRGALIERGSFNAGLAQTFVIPTGARELRFTILSADLGLSELNPGDAFEVALLDARTNEPLAGTLAGLDQADSLLNIQYDGTAFYSSSVSGPALTGSGNAIDLSGPVTLSIDVSEIPADTVAQLHFDLLGFGSDDSQVLIDDVRLQRDGLTGQVVAHHIFYNNSWYDGRDPAATAEDDAAIAPDKTPLLPGQAAGFNNYTSYLGGINGIMIDLQDPGDAPSLSASDFEFRVGNDHTPDDWQLAPSPSQILVRPGAGVDGSDRVTIVWPDQVIQKSWLQVTVKSNAITGLSSDEVVYWGNAIGEVGNSPASAFVDGTDLATVEDHQYDFLHRVAIDHSLDFNRDRLVDGTDWAIVRDHYTNFMTDLNLIRPAQVDSPIPAVADHLSPLDINQDGVVSPLDALLIINQLNGNSRRVGLRSSKLLGYRGDLDVNADLELSPLDALLVVNQLNQRRQPACHTCHRPPSTQ